MNDIFLMCYPFEIAHSIIRFYTILMIALLPLFWLSKKSNGNEAMRILDFIIEGYSLVPRPMYMCLQYLFMFPMPNISTRTDFIIWMSTHLFPHISYELFAHG